MTRALRPTAEQVDRAIVDAAAAIFASHGYAGTSIQQIADAVGYSKTGLLHRFPSKQALLDAVIARVRDVSEQAMTDAAVVPAGPDRPRAVIGLITDRTLDNPGIVRFMVESFRPGSAHPGSDEVRELAVRLVGLLDQPLADATQRVRVLLALQLVVNAASLEPSFDVAMPREDLRALVVNVATTVLNPQGES